MGRVHGTRTASGNKHYVTKMKNSSAAGKPLAIDKATLEDLPFAVVRFTINGLYLAAINIDRDRGEDGDWYTTISDDAERRLPFGDCATWQQIRQFGRLIEVATRWASNRSDGSPLMTGPEGRP
jgi:hypothetical protein